MKEIKYTKEGIFIGDNFISLNEITENCLKEQIKDENIVLLRMEWESSRNFDGIVEEIALPLDNAKKIKSVIAGKEIYFGEISGKHSDISGTLDSDEITIIEDIGTVLSFIKSNPSKHKYNHSFLNCFSEYSWGGGYDDLTKKDIEEFDKLF